MENTRRSTLFLGDGFRNLDFFCIDLTANAFQRSKHTQKISIIFDSFLFIFYRIIYLFEKQKLKVRWLVLAYPKRIV